MRKFTFLLASLAMTAVAYGQVKPVPKTPLPGGPVIKDIKGPTQPVQRPPAGTLSLPPRGPNTTDHGVRITNVEVRRGTKAIPVGIQGTGVTGVQITFTGLPPNTDIELPASRSVSEFSRSVNYPINSPRCIGENVNTFATFGRSDASGKLTIQGFPNYRTPAGAPAGADADGPCAARMILRFRRLPTQQPELIAVQSEPFPLPQFQTYRFTNTAALARYFNFQPRARRFGNICSGTSTGPTSYQVGSITVGRDLALRVRSGPLGSDCGFASPGAAVPSELRLTAIEWEVVKDGDKCCVGSECSSSIFMPGYVPSNDPSIYQADSQFIADSNAARFGLAAPRLRADQRLIGFAHLDIRCEATAVNDHGATVILKSATFEGPPGLSLP